MKKINIVKENRDFSRIINKGKRYWNDTFSIYYSENDKETYRFGISVSKKIGNAVTRNKIKRQIRNIVDKYKNIYPKNQDYIIIVRKNYINLTFNEVSDKYIELMRKITHIKEKKDEEKK